MSKLNEFSIGDGKSIAFCNGSNTIRQFPQNYCLAVKRGGVWVCDVDGAVDVKTGLMVQMTLMCDSVKFMDGQQVPLFIESNYRNYSIEVNEK